MIAHEYLNQCVLALDPAPVHQVLDLLSPCIPKISYERKRNGLFALRAQSYPNVMHPFALVV